LCCLPIDKDCNFGDPCKIYGCDTVTGCTSTPKCPASTDPCVLKGCNSDGTCYTTPVDCSPPSGCFSGRCDNSTGTAKCIFDPLCNDNNVCTDDACVNGACESTGKVCGDSDSCTTNGCNSVGDCTSATITCNDNNNCTLDSCNPLSGCQYTTSDDLCNLGDVCNTYRCDVDLGCVTTNIVCPVSNSQCLIPKCISFQGCVNESYVCNSTKNNQEDKCQLVSCTENPDEICQIKKLACGAPLDITTVAVAASISAAALVGIIIGAAALFSGIAAGGAVAYRQLNNGEGMTNTANNPLYVESKDQGQNPLYQG